MILMLPGAPPQQVQQIRCPVLPLRDVKPPDRCISDHNHQQVPQLSIP